MHVDGSSSPHTSRCSTLLWSLSDHLTRSFSNITFANVAFTNTAVAASNKVGKQAPATSDRHRRSLPPKQISVHSVNPETEDSANKKGSEAGSRPIRSERDGAVSVLSTKAERDSEGRQGKAKRGLIAAKDPTEVLDAAGPESKRPKTNPTRGDRDRDKDSAHHGSNDKEDDEEEDDDAERRFTFPERLMELLDSEQAHETIWWLPDGKSFAMAPAKFTKTILRRHFQGTKLESLTRKLNRWGFKRVSEFSALPGTVAYFHPLFQKEEPALLKGMNGGKKKRTDHTEQLIRAHLAGYSNVAESPTRTANPGLSPFLSAPLNSLHNLAPSTQMVDPYTGLMATMPPPSAAATAATASVLAHRQIPPMSSLASPSSHLLSLQMPAAQNLLPEYPFPATPALAGALHHHLAARTFGQSSMMAPSAAPTPAGMVFDTVGSTLRTTSIAGRAGKPADPSDVHSPSHSAFARMAAEAAATDAAGVMHAHGGVASPSLLASTAATMPPALLPAAHLHQDLQRQQQQHYYRSLHPLLRAPMQYGAAADPTALRIAQIRATSSIFGQDSSSLRNSSLTSSMPTQPTSRLLDARSSLSLIEAERILAEQQRAQQGHQDQILLMQHQLDLEKEQSTAAAAAAVDRSLRRRREEGQQE